MNEDLPERNHPAHGVLHVPGRTAVVFVTVCTKDRAPWLADPTIHATLHEVWSEARAWLVGPYLLMPEHAHLFACPGEIECPLERWMQYWKRQFAIRVGDPSLRFQEGHWDTRMRDGAHFESKWEYVQHNPVRKGLVVDPEEWPYKGIVNEWSYTGR